MNIIYLQLITTAILVAISCSLPGTFLILRGTSLISDALGHVILLGIVLSFFITHNLHSPFIFIGATLTGIAMVSMIEMLIASKKMKPDAAMSTVFPFLFSVAIILINLHVSSIHIDTDAVLLGELAFTPFNKLMVGSYDCGPYSIWIMSIILLLNIITIVAFYPALKITTFDKDFAKTINYSESLTHYGLMALTCITIVGAFECAGAILVVAFMIVPPSSSSLLTHRLSHMLIASGMLAAIGAVAGSLVAHALNVSIAGSIATTNGIIFFLILFFKKK